MRLQEVLVVGCLTLSYAVAGGLVYCLGLLQYSWVTDMGISNSQAALINSITFAITLLPAPAIQSARDYFKIQPYFIFAITGPLTGAGMYFTSKAQTFPQLLVSNGIGFGIGILFAITGSLTTVYHYFLDDKVTIVTSIVSMGIGFGMIFIALVFKYCEPIYGWRLITRYQVALCLVYVLAAIIFFPPVSRFLGIKTRKEQEIRLKKLEKIRKIQEAQEKDRAEMAAAVASQSGDISDLPNGGGAPSSYQNDAISTDSSPDEDSDEGEFPMNSMSKLRNITITQSIRVKSAELWKHLITNPKFLLLLVSWLLAEATFNGVMDHQPVRITTMGYSVSSGANTLALSGAVQIFSRFGVGLLANLELVSVVRMSQVSKVVLGLFSVLSNIFPSLAFQTVYMFLVGACGGMLSTTDFILVKDCVTDGRELGLTMLLLVDGIFSLVFIAGAGMLYEMSHSYQLDFYIFGACSLVAFLLVLLLEFLFKLDGKKKQGYQPIGDGNDSSDKVNVHPDAMANAA